MDEKSQETVVDTAEQEKEEKTLGQKIKNFFTGKEYEGKEEKKVLEKDMLFATLDTSIRQIQLPHGHSFLLSDTVGFISHLPHELIKAFHSTLEEVRYADLLLQVVDASSKQHNQHTDRSGKFLHPFGFLSSFFRKEVPLNKRHRHIQDEGNCSAQNKWKQDTKYESQNIKYHLVFPQAYDHQRCKHNQSSYFPYGITI